METVRLSPDPNATDIPEELVQEANQLMGALQNPGGAMGQTDMDLTSIFPGLVQGDEQPRLAQSQSSQELSIEDMGPDPELLKQVFPGMAIEPPRGRPTAPVHEPRPRREHPAARPNMPGPLPPPNAGPFQPWPAPRPVAKAPKPASTQTGSWGGLLLLILVLLLVFR